MNALYPDSSLPPFFIVDDCEDDVFILRHRLREGGIRNPIRTFFSPSDALDFLRANPQSLPQILFTDIRMPVASGFTLISAVRDLPGCAALRIVVVSASNDSVDLERALECGANGYLIKFPPSTTLAEFVCNGPWISLPRVSSAVGAVID